MSEMVERVAEAIFEALGTCGNADLMAGAGTIDFNPETERRVKQLIARAAIEAMRYPTEAMKKAGAYQVEYDHEGNLFRAWESMIDEALK